MRRPVGRHGKDAGCTDWPETATPASTRQGFPLFPLTGAGARNRTDSLHRQFQGTTEVVALQI